MENNIRTYNSKTGTNGQRLNLVINEDRKEIFFHTCNVFDLGNINNDLGIKEIQRLKNEFINNGYKEVKYINVKNDWK